MDKLKKALETIAYDATLSALDMAAVARAALLEEATKISSEEEPIFRSTISPPSLSKGNSMSITLVPVTSSQIKAVGHDAATSTLVVEFNNSSKYEYANVPAALHADMMAAESVGSWFSKNIKKDASSYPFKQVS
jgi:hypothetical protein